MTYDSATVLLMKTELLLFQVSLFPFLILPHCCLIQLNKASFKEGKMPELQGYPVNL